MIIQVDENHNIIRCVHFGHIPEPDPTLFEIENTEVDPSIIENIFCYKYIDGEFVRNDSKFEEKVPELIEAKLRTMSEICKNSIFDGVVFKGKKYSLGLDDQTNITNLSILAAAGQDVPYHADGEECEVIPAQEFVEFASYCQQFKLCHLTYYNQLKLYVNSLTSIEDILAVNYGMELPTEYMEKIHALTQGISDDYANIIKPIEDIVDYSSIVYNIDIDRILPMLTSPGAEPEVMGPEEDEADDVTVIPIPKDEVIPEKKDPIQHQEPIQDLTVEIEEEDNESTEEQTEQVDDVSTTEQDEHNSNEDTNNE